MPAAAIERDNTAIREISTPEAKPRTFYLPSLDILRFFALLVVFVFHQFQRTFVREYVHPLVFLSSVCVSSGQFGVDLFFTISAYLITTLLLRERSVTGALHVRSFYIRRVLRIWPLYFLYLFLILGLSGFYVTFHTPWKFAALNLLLLGNFANCLWNWPTNLTPHLWSISIEEQFYLLWPLVVRRSTEQQLARVAVLMLVVSTICHLMQWSVAASRAAMLCNTFGRLDPIAAGILIAVWLRDRELRMSLQSRLGLIVSGAVLWLLAAGIGNFDAKTFAAFTALIGFPMVAAGSALIVVAAIASNPTTSRPIAGMLVYLGKISYGLYIYHVLAIFIAVTVVADHAALFGHFVVPRAAIITVFAFGLTVLCAAISYRWFEHPFLSLKARFTFVPSRPV